ncbi:MAG: PhzF family phenazine biosynthesis protein [Christensenellaceae bacterium]|nr:PhzF family phenazine biosynthesis protein [Christensenellaceae bacterium]
MDIYVASAFSKNGSGGNKAGVVINEADLTAAQKLSIARELGYSETAFVLNSSAADYKLEYYTPTDEVPLCGHATIAAFYILKLLNMLEKQDYKIETKAGILRIHVKENGMIFMEQNCPECFEVLKPDMFAGCLEDLFIDNSLPIQIISTGLKDIMLPIDTMEHLEGLTPDFEVMTDLSMEKDVVGVHAFTLTKDSNVTAICRNFAPLYGIDEESATGTSNCALACYLFKYYKKKTQYVFEQGHNLGEVSRIEVNIEYHDDVIDSVFVGGYGRLVCKRSL